MIQPPGHDVFDDLFQVLEQRKSAAPHESYVARLYAGGAPAINAKIMEEAHESCQAALAGNRSHLTHEICDLLFHAFVLAACGNVSLADIRGELRRRFGTSGIEEKARRAPGPNE